MLCNNLICKKHEVFNKFVSFIAFSPCDINRHTFIIKNKLNFWNLQILNSSIVALRRIGDPTMTYRALGQITFSVDNRDCLVIHTPHFAVKELVTNDVVELIDEHRFRWIGRYDHVINSGGVKVFPERIEQQIAPLFTRRFFIAACADEKWGECVALAIEGDPLSATDEAALLARIRERVGRYEVPRRLFYLPAFAETSSGKVIRRLP